MLQYLHFSSRGVNVFQWDVVWQQVEPGTVYHLRRQPPTHCCSLDETQRLSSSASRFWTNSLTAADSLTVISATTRLV